MMTLSFLAILTQATHCPVQNLEERDQNGQKYLTKTNAAKFEHHYQLAFIKGTREQLDTHLQMQLSPFLKNIV